MKEHSTDTQFGFVKMCWGVRCLYQGLFGQSWLYKSGINEEQQGGDILPLCDAAEIGNRTTHSLWVATDATTSQQTGKHAENSCKLTKSTEEEEEKQSLLIFFFLWQI